LRSRRLHCCAALVQKCLLGWAKRQQYARLRWATLIFQKHWRGLASCRAVLIRYQLQCLVTRAERHCAMMARLDCQMEDEGEPPALELHENELNNIIKEKNFGSLKILKNSNEKNYMEKDLNNKNIKRITNINNDAFKWNKYALANFQQSFSPTNRLLPYLRNFVNSNASNIFWQRYIAKQMSRTIKCGARREPCLKMDALALIEEQNDFDWKLYLRKELFLPLENNSDELYVDLSYRQIIRGLHYGEYQCNKILRSLQIFWPSSPYARCCDIQNQNKQQILFEIEFIELANIGYGRSKHEGADAIFISLLNGDRYTFQSPLARELSHLLLHILKSLHQNSIYAIALKDYNHCTVQHKMQSSENSVLSLLKGDLLILSSPLNKYLNNEEGKNEEDLIENVENTSSKMCGKNILSSKKIIEQEIINTTESKQNSDLFEYPTFYTAAVDPFGMPLICGPFPQPHTLERFSSTNFRLPEDGNRPSDVFGAYNGGGSPEPELWRHSFESLRAPLLKRISEQGNEAIAREEILRDEIYCQLIKQLTDNPIPLSEERGWELIWLCIGLFPPSRFLCREVEHFLRTRLVPMAADCAMRLQKALNQCSELITTEQQYCRLSPPHQVELEAIQYRQTQIYHKFYLPDGTQETIELISVELQKEGMPKTSTEAKLCFLQRIAKEPTFGSAFFEVKQSADPTLCSKLLIAINQDGMSLYELESKKYIRTHGFKQLLNWQSANTYFHLTLDNGNRLLFETILGHKLDDLLTSYIQTLISKQEKENGKQKISPLSKIAVLLHQYKPNNGSTSPILTNGN
uniref:MyTH4 domain-containing protein n=1 Tax=Meloidogyne javanica TaxID=6303 RepID=A0A915MWZ7_MELJA